MLSKSRLTLLRSLRQKKFRTEHGLFVAEGEKLVAELLQSDFGVQTVYATEVWIKGNLKLSKVIPELLEVTEEELERISSLITPQKVLAVAAIPINELDEAHLLKNYSLYLDGIRDPGNLGTIIRIADWFGIENIICSPDTAEIWNPKVVQASMGSLLRVQVHEMELEEYVSRLKKYAKAERMEIPPIYGTYLKGNSIYQTKFGIAGILVIGNEAKGIHEKNEKLISQKVTIPSSNLTNEASKGPESLNAAIATAIVCAEIRRLGAP